VGMPSEKNKDKKLKDKKIVHNKTIGFLDDRDL